MAEEKKKSGKLEELLLYGALILIASFSYEHIISEPSHVGRYKIYESQGSSSYLLDTATGESWRQVIMLDDNGELFTTYWQLMAVDGKNTSSDHIQEIFEEHNKSLKK